MREYEPETRARGRKAIRPQAGVEFLDEQDGQSKPLEPDDGMGNRPWLARAAIVGLVGMVLIAGAVIPDARPSARRAAPASSKIAAAPRLSCGRIIPVPAGDLPVAISRITTRALPGIRLTDAVARVACLLVGAPAWLRTRALDARYKQLLITVEISPGKPSSGTRTQIVASGASNAYIIHSRRRSTRRTVTVTVIAPHCAHIPLRRLHRMADQLARLRGMEWRPGKLWRSPAARPNRGAG